MAIFGVALSVAVCLYLPGLIRRAARERRFQDRLAADPDLLAWHWDTPGPLGPA